jgi:Recombination endonuclease VII
MPPTTEARRTYDSQRYLLRPYSSKTKEQKDTHRKAVAKYAKNHPNHRYIHKLKSTYGLSKEQYDKMSIAQNGLCKVCLQKEPRHLSVDHSHKTNKVRGLLCRNCNMAAGFLRDNPDICEALARYLRENA